MLVWSWEGGLSLNLTADKVQSSGFEMRRCVREPCSVMMTSGVLHVVTVRPDYLLMTSLSLNFMLGACITTVSDV